MAISINRVRGWMILFEVDTKNPLSGLAPHAMGGVLPNPLTHDKGMVYDWDIGGGRFLRMLLIEIDQ